LTTGDKAKTPLLQFVVDLLYKLYTTNRTTGAWRTLCQSGMRPAAPRRGPGVHPRWRHSLGQRSTVPVPAVRW